MTLIETGELSKQECKTTGCSAKTTKLYNTVTKKYTYHGWGADCDCFYDHLMAWKPKHKEQKNIKNSIFEF